MIPQSRRRALVLAAVAVPVFTVAVIAGVVSFGHIETLALRAHQPVTAARLYPFSIDGLIVAGVVIVLAGYWLGWLAVVLGISATVFANVQSGLPYGTLAATVAAWPAVAFTVASFVLERWLRRLVITAGQGWPEVAASGPSAQHPADARQDDGEQPAAAPARCGHVMTGDPATVVVNAYLHGRDCLGEKPSQRSLAATYGLHRTKVAALVGHLNGHVKGTEHEIDQ